MLRLSNLYHADKELMVMVLCSPHNKCGLVGLSRYPAKCQIK